LARVRGGSYTGRKQKFSSNGATGKEASAVAYMCVCVCMCDLRGSSLREVCLPATHTVHARHRQACLTVSSLTRMSTGSQNRTGRPQTEDEEQRNETVIARQCVIRRLFYNAVQRPTCIFA